MNAHRNKIHRSLLAAVVIAALLAGFAGMQHVQAAGPWFVGPAGNDANDCLSEATACLTIQGALAKANPGETIHVLAGSYAMTAASDQVAISKAGVTIQGAGPAQTLLTTTAATGNLFRVLANNVTITGLSIEKTDSANQNLVYVQADGFSFANNLVFGHYVHGTDEISRAFEVAYGSENLTITGNTFHHLRQPGYFNGNLSTPTTGVISNNLTYYTKGWVINGANFTFTNNTWGNGADVNVYDVAILAATPAEYYTNLVAVSEANNDAVIEDQRVSPAVLTVVHVDALATAPGTGGRYQPYPTISQAIPRVMAGGKIFVAGGTYLEEVNLNKAGVRLLGAGYETTILMGRKSEGGANTLTLGANNVLVDGFTITRDGNNVADWAANVKNQGVIFNQGTTGSTLQNCRVTGNRNGVYLNNTQNQTVRNNIITNNRTGMQLVNNVTGLVVNENEITNNWTMGVLFNFNSGSYTTSVQITNNNITGNWYGQVQNRWAVENGVMNVSGNWFGSTAITTSDANSAEPGYADLIPVAFGGTATPPSTPVAIIGGVRSAMVDYSPWLASGVDTNLTKTGFQGDYAILFVDDVAQAANTASSIQEAIDAVAPHGVINILPGSYSETAVNRQLFDNTGPYQFGLFVGAAKSGITLQGVDASGAAIANYAGIAASVATNATNSFGYSGIFVEGDDVTISGLRILPNLPSDNKTIEVLGDNFTLKASHIDVPGGGSVYLNDWRFDNVARVSHLQRYTILDNLFAQGASLDIASGAGYSGPVAGRVVQGNRFEYTSTDYWPAISFSGKSVVPWYTSPVNGATITGNTFVGTTQHIRARGEYDNATFDWLGYRAGNTFEKTVVAFVGATTEVRAFEYSTTYGMMTNVRRIGASIQAAVNDAQAGDTVDASAGVYTEQVTIAKDITLRGDAHNSILQAYANMPSCFTTSAENRPIVCIKDTADATIRGFTIDGLGLGNVNNRFVGVAFRNAGGTVQDNVIRDIRNTPFDGTQHGVGIFAMNEDALTHTIHVLDNTVTGFQKTGIALNGSATNPLVVDVRRNTVTGVGATTITAQNGIQIWAQSGGGVVAENIISGIAYDNTSSATKWIATSILNYYANLVTTGNTVSGAHMGIYYYEGRGLVENNSLAIEKIGVYAYGINAADPPQAVPSPYGAPADFAAAPAVDPMAAVNEVEISRNTISFSGADKTYTYGIESDAGYGANDLSVNVHHNRVSGFDNGLVFYQCDVNCGAGVFNAISAVSNDLTDNTIGIYLGGAIPTAVSPAIHHNRIYSTVATDSGLVSDLAAPITAENNWWGCNAGPADAACTGVIGQVDADPWLVLTLAADQSRLIPGGAINLVLSLSRNSDGVDTAPAGYVLDGIPAGLATTYGTLNPLSVNLVNAAAPFALDVPAPITVTGATVSATVDGQTVQIIFDGLRIIFLPYIGR